MSVCVNIDPVEVLIEEEPLDGEDWLECGAGQPCLEGQSEGLVGDGYKVGEDILDEGLVLGGRVDDALGNSVGNTLVSCLVGPGPLNMDDT